MKPFLFAVLVTWGLMFAGDYYSIRQHGTAEFCGVILKWPIWFHLLFPGAGNACIDMGLFK